MEWKTWGKKLQYKSDKDQIYNHQNEKTHEGHLHISERIPQEQNVKKEQNINRLQTQWIYNA